MRVQIAKQEEIPDQREREMRPNNDINNNEELFKVLTSPAKEEKTEKETNTHGIPEIAMELVVPRPPTVFLSGKKNIKILTNWMRKHMEAYPETKGGFSVLFDINPKYGFYVDTCSIIDSKPDITIDGISYKIYPHKFDDKYINSLQYEKLHNQFKNQLENVLNDKGYSKYDIIS